MSSEETKTPGVQGSQDLQYLDVDLRNPWVAGICAWLFPGAGHFYQRRYMKGCIFMICVLSLYLGGLVMGGGHVVYASWKPQAKRWQYLFQLGVGIPAFPALVQAQRARADEFLDEVRAADFNPPDNQVTVDELFDLYRIKESDPRLSVKALARYHPSELLDELDANADDVLSMEELASRESWFHGWMAPPGPFNPHGEDRLAQWHFEYGALFDMGTLYTLVAGVLNVLVIFDAHGGPLILAYEQDEEKQKSVQIRRKFN